MNVRSVRAVLFTALLVVVRVPTPASGASARWLVAFEAPAEHVLHELATAHDVDVRWVERDLVLAEVVAPETLPSVWGGRVLGRREPDQELALLHGRHAAALHKASATRVLHSLSARRVATLHTRRDAIWVLLGPWDGWPNELLGCHGGLRLPAHGLDPRSALDAGAPAPLLPWVLQPARAWTPVQREVLNSVQEDSLVAYFDLLVRNEIGLPADRYVFSPDLQDVYIPRVQAVMQNALAGIPGAAVELQSFSKTRACPAGDETVDTANVIGRIPGTVPGTGTFVVCAHLDATGSSNTSSDPPGNSWVEQRTRCETVSQTPGGEDNASGVATFLEVMRCIAAGVRAGDVSFAFDLEFVAFSGEEAEGKDDQPGDLNRFLTGSEHYVRERRIAGTTLLAAFNLDMVGSEHLGNTMQVVYNPASSWLADVLVEAASHVDPPLDLTLRPEEDVALASDHNSFWTVNAAAILGADAPVDTLRTYATYHQPTDTGLDRDVRSGKMREVGRAVVGTLLRFDANAHSEPNLFVPLESFRTTIELFGNEARYDHTFLRLLPGDVVRSQLKLFNVGARYVGPVRYTLRKEREDGSLVVLVDETLTRDLPTGGLVDFEEPVPILASDSGIGRLVAEVGWLDGGVEVAATVVDTLTVRGRHNPEFVAFVPNPVRNLQDVALLLELSEPGTVTLHLYNLEGEIVFTMTQPVGGRIINADEEPVLTTLSLNTSSAKPLDLVSGPYVARVEFRGDDGSRTSGSGRLVVVR